MSAATCCRHHAARFRPITVEPPDQFTGRAADFEDGMRRHRHAAIRECRERCGVIEHRNLVGADRQRRRVGQRACAVPSSWRASTILLRPARGLPLPIVIESLTGMVLIGAHQRAGQRLRPRIAARIIVRAPIADADRAVDHHAAGFQPVNERRRIDVRLERRTRLAQRIGGAVELAFAVIAAADDCAHSAVIVEHGRSLPDARHIDVRSREASPRPPVRTVAAD